MHQTVKFFPNLGRNQMDLTKFKLKNFENQTKANFENLIINKKAYIQF